MFKLCKLSVMSHTVVISYHSPVSSWPFSADDPRLRRCRVWPLPSQPVRKPLPISHLVLGRVPRLRIFGRRSSTLCPATGRLTYFCDKLTSTTICLLESHHFNAQNIRNLVILITSSPSCDYETLENPVRKLAALSDFGSGQWKVVCFT